MARGVNIPITADAAKVISEGRKVEGALDDVIDSLDEVGREAKNTDKVIDTAMEGVEKSAKSAADDLETKFSTAFDKVKKEARTAGDTVNRETRQGADKAGEGVQSFKDEAVQNFSEVASSFSGDMSQAADGVQGLLGGLASALPGPVGLIAGLLGGIGGAMLAGFQKGAEESEQRVADMYENMKESRSTFLNDEYFADAVSAIVDDAKKFEQAQRIASESGVSVGVALRAMAGDTEYAALVSEQFERKYGDLKRSLEDQNAYERSRAGQKNLTDEQRHGLDVMDEWVDVNGQVARSTDTARDKFEAWRGAVSLGNDALVQGKSALDAYNDTPLSNKTAKVSVDFSEADRQIAAWQRDPRNLTITARVGLKQVT